MTRTVAPIRATEDFLVFAEPALQHTLATAPRSTHRLAA